MLNSTAFGRLMTMLVKELGFEKRKVGTVTVYYGVCIERPRHWQEGHCDSWASRKFLVSSKGLLAIQSGCKKRRPHLLLARNVTSLIRELGLEY
jgi:hypothetical protein